MTIPPYRLLILLSGLAIQPSMLATEPAGFFILLSVSFNLLLIGQVIQGPTIFAYYLTQ
jgi:hypothetical protein